VEAAFHRDLHPFLELSSAHSIDEEIAIATEVLGWREPDRVDSLFD
jgi:hypothetical protein